MPEDRIRLEIVTPERQVFHQMVEWFYVPSQSGPTGIEENHAPLITALIPGELRYHREGADGVVVVSEGFLEMRENEAEILVHSAELAEDIDVERALAARERALKRLAENSDSLDVARAKASLARATARLKAKAVE